MRLIAFAALSLAIWGAVGPVAVGQESIDDVLGPAVLIRNEEGQSIGSAVALKVGNEVLVLTCAHVLDDHHRTTREQKGDVLTETTTKRAVSFVTRCCGQEVAGKGTIVWFDPKRDVALIRPSKPLRHYAVIDPKTEPVPGEDCWVVGASVEDWTVSRSPIAKADAKRGRLLFQAGIAWFGGSGSGLYVKRGGKFRLAGMLRGGSPNGYYRLASAVDLPTILRSLEVFSGTQ